MEPTSDDLASIENHSATKSFWEWGFQTVIYLDLSLSGLQLLRVLLAGGSALWLLIDAKTRNQPLLDVDSLVILAFVLPITFFICSVGCWLRKPTARILMIVYFCAEIAYQVGTVVHVAFQQPDLKAILMFSFLAIDRLGYLFGFIAINLMLITRTEVKKLFNHPQANPSPN